MAHTLFVSRGFNVRTSFKTSGFIVYITLCLHYVMCVWEYTQGVSVKQFHGNCSKLERIMGCGWKSFGLGSGFKMLQWIWGFRNCSIKSCDENWLSINRYPIRNLRIKRELSKKIRSEKQAQCVSCKCTLMGEYHFWGRWDLCML